MKNKLSRWIDKVLANYCQDNLLEGIQGDLTELFETEYKTIGPLRSNIRYQLRSLGFFRTTFSRSIEKRKIILSAMWKNHFITAYRSLKKQRQYFIINLIGLTIAITCLIFATVFAFDELSYDRFHANSKNIYRLYKKNVNPEKGTSALSAETSGQMGPTIVAEYPEAINYVRINPWYDDVVLSHRETNLRTKELVIADHTVFEVFDFRLIRGNPKTALLEPSTMVLTESFAKSLFGNKDPMGETVVGLEDVNYTVTGIVTDPPRNSHIQFDALMSWSTTVPGKGPLNFGWMNNWLSQAHYTYIEMAPGSDPEVITEKMAELIGIHLPERKDSYFLRLQPLEKVHLYSDEILYTRKMKIGSIQFVILLLVTAALIVIIAGVSYVNISLAKAGKSIKEVGLRKVIGSSKGQIVSRFLAETVTQVLLATFMAYILILLLLPYFNALTSKDLTWSAIFDWRITSLILGIIFLLNLVIGIYPAKIVAAHSPSAILNNSVRRTQIGWLRKVLLVAQYSISIALIIFTIEINKQTDFLISKTERDGSEQIIILDIDNEVEQHADALMTRLAQNPNILSQSACRASIGSGTYGTTVVPEGHSREMSTQVFRVDAAFDDTYGLKTLEGHFFRKEVSSDSNGLVVNRAFLDYLGWENGVGKTLRFTGYDVPFSIIGVIEDFHFRSPSKEKISPMLMYLDQENRPNLSIRVSGQDVKETISYIETVWKDFATRTPFDFRFVDQWFENEFRSEMKMLHTATTFSVISILLCLLGLYGLTALMLEQRIKEISIRKVLGAGFLSLSVLFNRQFIVLVLLGFLVAAPMTWWIVQYWLSSFAYQINPSTEPYWLASGLTLFVSVVTVSILTFRTSLINPAKTLRNE